MEVVGGLNVCIAFCFNITLLLHDDSILTIQFLLQLPILLLQYLNLLCELIVIILYLAIELHGLLLLELVLELLILILKLLQLVILLLDDLEVIIAITIAVLVVELQVQFLKVDIDGAVVNGLVLLQCHLLHERDNLLIGLIVLLLLFKKY